MRRPRPSASLIASPTGLYASSSICFHISFFAMRLASFDPGRWSGSLYAGLFLSRPGFHLGPSGKNRFTLECRDARLRTKVAGRPRECPALASSPSVPSTAQYYQIKSSVHQGGYAPRWSHVLSQSRKLSCWACLPASSSRITCRAAVRNTGRHSLRKLKNAGR